MSDIITVTKQNIKDYLCVTTDKFDTVIESLIGFWSPVIETKLTPAALSGSLPIVLLGKILIIAGNVKRILPQYAVGVASGRYEFTQGDVKIVQQRTDKQDVDLVAQGEAMLLPYYTDDYKDTIESSNANVQLEFTLERVDENGNTIQAGNIEW